MDLNREGGGDFGRQRVYRADASGNVEVRGLFGNGAMIHASSPDGAYQTSLRKMAVDIQSAVATPPELTLSPAVTHEVVVLSEGRPVEGAQVMAEGFGFDVYGTTESNGRVQLLIPATEPLRELVAWHPQLGVAGIRDLDDKPANDSSELSLRTPRSSYHSCRSINADSRSVVSNSASTYASKTAIGSWSAKSKPRR